MNKIEKIKEILNTTEPTRTRGYNIGENVFIRSLTHYYTGHVVDVDDYFIYLSDAAWIADTGRFSQAINDGKLNEIEPVDCIIRVAHQNIIDVLEWRHALPRGQK